jgi:catechol 2,3-dioxygenase-like lactoylglutathione lyase family enzyme
MRLLRAATLVTPNPDATTRLYEKWFDYKQVEAGVVATDLAEAWGTSAMAGRQYSLIMPASGAPVYLRLIAGQPLADYRPLRSFGWGAIEICVQDVLAVHEKMQRSPFAVIGPPKALDGSPSIWPMQVQGPDGEIIFLTEIRDDEPEARLPRAGCLVDCLFIAVLACADMAATRAWFEANLGLRGGPDFELAYTMLSRAFGLPATAKHKIAVLGHQNDAFLQLDQYPPGAEHRTGRTEELPPGIAMVSFQLPGNQMPTGPAALCHPGLLYDGGKSLALRTPEGAMVEVIAAPGKRAG